MNRDVLISQTATGHLRFPAVQRSESIPPTGLGSRRRPGERQVPACHRGATGQCAMPRG